MRFFAECVMYEKELHKELTKLWDDPDFADGALCHLATDEQRKKVLDAILSGKIDSSTKAIFYIMELVGIFEKADKQMD